MNGKTEYFIKWKDWPASTNTWEPVEHLSCEEKVKEFEEKLTATKAAQAAARKKVAFSNRSDWVLNFMLLLF